MNACWSAQIWHACLGSLQSESFQTHRLSLQGLTIWNSWNPLFSAVYFVSYMDRLQNEYTLKTFADTKEENNNHLTHEPCLKPSKKENLSEF